MRHSLLLSLFLYLVGFSLSFYLPADGLLPDELITKGSENILAYTKLTKFDLALKILKNNTIVLLINIFGAFSFGLLTKLNLLINGLVLSISLKALYSISGIKGVFFHFLPHSIEVIGIVLSGSIGFIYSYQFYKFLFLNSKHKFSFHLKIVFLSFFIILLAAFLESYVSIS